MYIPVVHVSKCRINCTRTRRIEAWFTGAFGGFDGIFARRQLGAVPGCSSAPLLGGGVIFRSGRSNPLQQDTESARNSVETMHDRDLPAVQTRNRHETV